MVIEKIETDGFLVNDIHSKHNDIAFISLRIALKAYFETYKNMHSRLSSVKGIHPSLGDPDSIYSMAYIENACEAIIHFQHFVELIVKDILRQKHILLAMDVSDQHEMFADLLEGKAFDEKNIRGRSIEFSESFTRLRALLKASRFGHADYDFFLTENWLLNLNRLRNRINHRGVYVIRYMALDALFGKYALPLMKKILGLPRYSSQKIWQYRGLNIGIDPVDEIIHCFTKKYYLEKVALLKELGRAAYENPILFTNRKKISGDYTFDIETVRRAESVAVYINKAEYAGGIKQCPVCGTNSLVLFDDTVDNEDDEGNTIGVEHYIYKVECTCCSFRLNNELSDLKKMHLPLEDFWAIP